MRLRDYLNPMHGWRDSSVVDKVRAYTRQSFLVMIAAIAFGSVATAVQNDTYVAAAAALGAAAAAFVVLQRTAGLGGVSTHNARIPLIVLCLCAAAAIVFGGAELVLWEAILVSSAVAGLIDLRWSIAEAIGAVALAAIFGLPGVQVVLLGLFIVGIAVTVRLSMWLLRIVTELDAARDAAAALSVAEERLRFSRDLHDVVGRALSAIAVKSELAATLARRGDDRAAAQMDEVRELAQESMSDARELVRGYRSVDVASELVGARSLLSAAGIRTELIGDVSDVPHRVAEQAAWVVREGVTNILRHSSATYCRIEFDPNIIRIANDAPAPAGSSRDGTGLSGLRERLAAVGGSLTVDADPETFTLTAQFSHSEAMS